MDFSTIILFIQKIAINLHLLKRLCLQQQLFSGLWIFRQLQHFWLSLLWRGFIFWSCSCFCIAISLSPICGISTVCSTVSLGGSAGRTIMFIPRWSNNISCFCYSLIFQWCSWGSQNVWKQLLLWVHFSFPWSCCRSRSFQCYRFGFSCSPGLQRWENIFFPGVSDLRLLIRLIQVLEWIHIRFVKSRNINITRTDLNFAPFWRLWCKIALSCRKIISDSSLRHLCCWSFAPRITCELKLALWAGHCQKYFYYPKLEPPQLKLCNHSQPGSICHVTETWRTTQTRIHFCVTMKILLKIQWKNRLEPNQI